MRRKTNRIFTKDVEVEVEIYCEDVVEFIEDYATDHELQEINDRLVSVYPKGGVKSFEYSDHEGTLVQDSKFELLKKAALKYSLQELEERLGSLY
jgi:hypothetical protein